MIRSCFRRIFSDWLEGGGVTKSVLFRVVVALASTLGAVVAPASAQTNNQCDLPGESPDVIVGNISGRVRHGSLGGITAFSVGTTSCNVGTCWLNWVGSTNEHPVIAQNMFRLKSGRFEQIGQSWLKHGFTALQETYCSTTCMDSGTGSRLGVRCSDPYSSGLNGTQSRLGPKFEVDAFTGEFPYPATGGSLTGDAIYKRLQVHNVDLDPALNAGASYFVEAQYVTGDDAKAGNGANNASYRPLTVSGTTTFDITLTGATVQTKPAIEAWKAADPTVTLTTAQVSGEGRFFVASRATDLGGGQWHYEYAVHNFDSQRSAGSFSVPIPAGTTVTNVGFHDVDYHSGEPLSGTDWTSTTGGNPPSVSWATVPYGVDPNANALRWGTLYNFRFDANVPPATTSVAIGLFRPGTGSSIAAVAVTPRLCDGDGVCDPEESCERCPADCSAQGGGVGCCGNGTCEAGESPCLCPADCGPQTPSEATCGNAVDDDCDGEVDCTDTDCCSSPLCVAADGDGDLWPAVCDCDDVNGSVWATPGEALGLTAASGTEWHFSPPLAPGGSVFVYDLIRSLVRYDFMTATVCIGAPDPAQPARTDFDVPALNQVFYYLVRAHNACPNGDGPLGTDSSGLPLVGDCP